MGSPSVRRGRRGTALLCLRRHDLENGPEKATQLNNAGGAEPLIRIRGPWHATFRNFLANGGNAAVGILVGSCDHEQARLDAVRAAR